MQQHVRERDGTRQRVLQSGRYGLMTHSTSVTTNNAKTRTTEIKVNVNRSVIYDCAQD